MADLLATGPTDAMVEIVYRREEPSDSLRAWLREELEPRMRTTEEALGQRLDAFGSGMHALEEGVGRRLNSIGLSMRSLEEGLGRSLDSSIRNLEKELYHRLESANRTVASVLDRAGGIEELVSEANNRLSSIFEELALQRHEQARSLPVRLWRWIVGYQASNKSSV